MPFKSRAQEKWMFANKPAMAQEWADETPDISALPKRVGKKVNYKRTVHAKDWQHNPKEVK